MVGGLRCAALIKTWCPAARRDRWGAAWSAGRPSSGGRSCPWVRTGVFRNRSSWEILRWRRRSATLGLFAAALLLAGRQRGRQRWRGGGDHLGLDGLGLADF